LSVFIVSIVSETDAVCDVIVKGEKLGNTKVTPTTRNAKPTAIPV
jgi:hypothetical protein